LTGDAVIELLQSAGFVRAVHESASGLTDAATVQRERCLIDWSDELEADVLAGGWISCENQTALDLRALTPTGTAFAWSNIK
jgi:hypothetical protein